MTIILVLTHLLPLLARCSHRKSIAASTSRRSFGCSSTRTLAMSERRGHQTVVPCNEKTSSTLGSNGQNDARQPGALHADTADTQKRQLRRCGVCCNGDDIGFTPAHKSLHIYWKTAVTVSPTVVFHDEHMSTQQQRSVINWWHYRINE